VPANTVKGISLAIEELVARWQANQLADSDSPYTARAAVEQLVGWVDEILKVRHRVQRVLERA
jgi:hypothetical protein